MGSVIQANGRVEFENVLRIGNQLNAQHGLQTVSTIPGVLLGAHTKILPLGRLNSNLLRSMWPTGVKSCTMIDSRQLQCYDLTLLREVVMFFLFPQLT